MKNRINFFISLVVILCFAVSQITFAAEIPAGNTDTTGTSFEENQGASEESITTENNGSEIADEDSAENGSELKEADEDDNSSKKDKTGENTEKSLDVAREVIEKFKFRFDAAKDALEEQKDDMDEAKDVLKEQKDKLEELKDSLEEQYEKAKEAGDLELAQQVREKILQAEEEMDSLKEQIKQAREYVKEIIRNAYSEEELEKLEQLTEKLEAMDKNIIVLPVENVLVKGRVIKFDTLPIIKEGRTLVPVRALSEAFGAEVEWVGEEKKVIITRGETEVILTLNNDTAYVNGDEVKLDVPSEAINNRTLVPLRFILESLGLKVDWDNDTQTIEIEEE